jgi:hypothetical protein
MRRFLVERGLDPFDPPDAQTWQQLTSELGWDRDDASTLDGARFQVLVHSLGVGVLVEDAGRKVAATNQAFCDLFAIPAAPGTLAGVDCSGAAQGAAALTTDPAGFLARIDSLMGAGERAFGDVVLLRDGRVLERDYAPVVVDGRACGHVWLYRDVTPSHEAAEQLRAARDAAEAARTLAEAAARVKDEFLTTMSHELRSPLTCILGITELLLERAAGEDRRSLQLVLESGSTLLALLNELLDLSKLRAGRFQLSMEPFDLRSHVADIIESLDVLASRKSLSLQVHIDDRLASWVSGDALRLRQIITNLVSNAIKFTPRGRVALHVMPSATSGVRFEVRDDGPGLDAAQRAKLFHSFERLDANWSRAQAGTGLGLVISQALVASMGGKIDLVSVPGEGSTFFFEIPLPAAAADPDSGQGLDTASSTAPRSLTVLVAEDDPANRHFLLKALQRLGHHPQVVGDGQAALDVVTEGKHFDAIILDLSMPRMDGLAASRAIRIFETDRRRTPILALTANAMRGDAERCRAAGMDEYLSKPVGLDALDAVLTRMTGFPTHRTVDRRTRSVIPPRPPVLDEARLALLESMSGTTTASLKDELIALFVQELPAQVASLRDELRRGDTAAVRRVSHRLKGSCSSIGASALSSLAMRIETGALVDSDASGLCDELDGEVGRLLTALAP